MNKISLTIIGLQGEWCILDKTLSYSYKSRRFTEIVLIQSSEFGDLLPMAIIDSEHNLLMKNVKRGFDEYHDFLCRKLFMWRSSNLYRLFIDGRIILNEVTRDEIISKIKDRNPKSKSAFIEQVMKQDGETYYKEVKKINLKKIRKKDLVF